MTESQLQLLSSTMAVLTFFTRSLDQSAPVKKKRSFLALRHLKTWYRATMTEDRLWGGDASSPL
jgi:hypothetical protein